VKVAGAKYAHMRFGAPIHEWHLMGALFKFRLPAGSHHMDVHNCKAVHMMQRLRVDHG